MPLKANVLIGTPSGSYTVMLSYLESVFGLMNLLRGTDISCELITHSSAMIEMSRNLMASIVLDRKDISHLLFIDSDMGFEPKLIPEMIAFDKPVVSILAPQRHLDMKMVQDAPKRPTAKEVQYIANRYVHPALIRGEQGFLVRDGFVQVSETGCGVMLIKREVFEQMALLPGMVIENFTPPDERFPRRLLNCFRVTHDDTGLLIGEDFSFCHRWTRQCGGEIWANIANEITHTGVYNFKGRFADLLSMVSEQIATRRAAAS